MRGVELADSFNFNPHKWLPVGLDCSATWFRAPFDGAARVGSAMLDVREDADLDGGRGVPDYMHWQIPFGRRSGKKPTYCSTVDPPTLLYIRTVQ